MSLNEQLAVEVMGWTWTKHLPTFGDARWRDADGNDPIGGDFDREGDWFQTLWSPTTDLNQLRMCYEALSEDELIRMAKLTLYAPFDAIFTNPQSVARAILKAKGVS